MADTPASGFDLRKEFLLGFINFVINEVEIKKKKELPFDKDRILEKLMRIEKKDKIKEELESETASQKQNLINKKEHMPSKKSILKIKSMPPRKMLPMQVPRIARPPGVYLEKVKPGPPVPEQITISSMEKINSILNDPAVQMIECLGPEKQILVYKSGVIQNTNIVLSNDDINLLMKEISEKTKIPLMSGVFKTALGNMVITAVISDFIGTRFMMQRKTAVPV